MSAVLLIRHGQASFGEADYDILSDLGAEQSARLGAYLADQAVRIDAVYRGPRRRHAETEHHMRRGASAAGLELPDSIVLDGLDEYPAFDLYAYWLPILADNEPELASRLRSGSLRAMEQVSAMWANGQLDTGGLETFADFDQRVTAAIERIRSEQGSGKTVAVVTSGGPVGIAVRGCLDLSPTKTIGVSWALENASITELRYRVDSIGLIALNRIAHLREPRLRTYK